MVKIMTNTEEWKIGVATGKQGTPYAEHLATAQHERTLAWLRDRLAAGEHLDDLLAEG